MADGWTDRYHGRSYVGIRISCIKDWQYHLYTLSCHTMPGSHTGKHLADHIRKILSSFFPDLKKMLIAACHDGAANMKKSSELLKVQSMQHCVAHSLHLLITVDSMWRIDELKDLVQKCRDIVTALHFQSDLLEGETTSVADLAELAKIQQKISEVSDVVDTDDQFPITMSEIEEDEVGNTALSVSAANLAKDISTQQSQHRHISLKGSCPTRWNSTLVMIESVVDLHKAVDNTLKKIGHAELCLTSGELDLLKSLKSFLKGFEKFTELVSFSVPTLSMIPLMKLQIKKMCVLEPGDEDAITTLKELVLANVDRRLTENEFMKINQVFDPMTKGVMPEEEAASFIMRAFDLAKQKGIMAALAGPNESSDRPNASSTMMNTTDTVCSVSSEQLDDVQESAEVPEVMMHCFFCNVIFAQVMHAVRN